MQAVILCAGTGSRIQDITKGSPKCLLNIGDKSILRHQVEAIKKYTGKSPIVVVGYKAEMIEEHLAGEDVKFVYNADYLTTNILASLHFALPKVESGLDLISMPGDLVFDQKIIGALLSDDSDLTVAVQKRECDDEAVKVILENGKVISIGKKIKTQGKGWEFIGMLKVKSTAVEDFKQTVNDIITKGQKGGYVFTAIEKTIKKGGVNVGYTDVRNYLWEEVDFAEDYNQANKKFSKQNQLQNKQILN